MRSHLPTAGRVLCVLAVIWIAIYFWWFVRVSLGAEFTHDDLMNAYGASVRPYSGLLVDNVAFFLPSPNFRPFGALVYKVSVDLFGFNLLPLRVVLMLALAGGLAALGIAGSSLAGSREAGLLAALILAYHANFSMLYYNTGTLYDIFCFLFYFSALAYYLHIRRSGRLLSRSQSLVFLALFVLALNSKEMAVSLPVMIGVYELVFHPPGSFGRRAAVTWLGGEGRMALVTGIMTAAFLFGRMAGPEGLSQVGGGYRATVSLSEYLTKTGQYLDALVYADGWFTHGKTAGLLVLLPAIALVLRSKGLAVCALLFPAGILPLAFIPLRSAHAAIIPVAGLGLFVAILLAGARERLTGRRRAWQAAASQAALFVLVGALLLRAHPDTWRSYIAWHAEYDLIRGVRQEMSRLHARMPRQGRMLIVTDPFGKFDWTSVFLARLLYRDDRLTVDRVAKMDPKLDAAAAAKYDAIMTYQDGRLIDMKPCEVRIGP